MKKKIAVFVLLFCSLSLLFFTFVNDIPYSKVLEIMQTISGRNAKYYALFLASQEMRGRDTGSQEQLIAARYIATQFEKWGLKPGGDRRSYYQNFYLENVDIGKDNYLKLTVPSGSRNQSFPSVYQYQFGIDFVPQPISVSAELINAPVVFCGFGVNAPEYEYNDYKGIDIKGKVVLVLSNEPQQTDPNSVWAGRRDTWYNNTSLKSEAAYKAGAAAVLYFANYHLGNQEPNAATWKSLQDDPAYLKRRSTPNYRLPSDRTKLPFIQVGSEFVERLMSRSGKSLKDVQERIDRTNKPESFEIPGVTVSLRTSVNVINRVRTMNVVGIVEGRDAAVKDESVVLGGHHDHVGVNGIGDVYPGAFDNAAGASAVMEIARAYAEGNLHPKRSLVFIAFSGEELGLYGSRYYCMHPVMPLHKVKTMLNFDLIGMDNSYKTKNDTAGVTLFYAQLSPELKDITERVNKDVGMKISYNDWLLSRSDHGPFSAQKIPSIFYINPGSGAHTPQDTPDKLQADVFDKTCKLGFLTAWEVAEGLTVPTFTFDYIKNLLKEQKNSRK